MNATDTRLAPMPPFDSKKLSGPPDVIAPDGSEVRILCATARCSTALFTLAAGMTAKAVTHRTVDEIWYVIDGDGQLRRRFAGYESVITLGPGISLTIPTGTSFQFRNDGATPLQIVAVTTPSWPGEGEALAVEGKWPPTV